MRISTGQIFQRGIDGMQNQNMQLAKLLEQINSGKRIAVSSDDPVAAGKINLMRQRISATEQLDKNRLNAQGVLGLELDSLSQTVAITQKLRELQIQAGNPALSEADRKSYSGEVQQLLNQMQQLANSQDSEGNYLFSGSKSLTQPIMRTAGQYVYNGDDTQRFQAVGEGSLIPISDTGKNIFMQISSGNKDFSVSELPPYNTGTVILATGSVTNRAAYVADNYTISFALNTANEMVVMVTGAAGGNILPPSGLPDDALLYKDGDAIVFNGIEISATGQPAAGDAFTLNPSQNESIFSTVQRMFDNLNQPVGASAERAKIVTENNQILAQLDNAMENFLSYQSQVGSRLNQLVLVEEKNGNLIESSKTILRDMEDIDPAEVYLQYNMQLLGLQAAQQSFVKIQGLSIFNYM